MKTKGIHHSFKFGIGSYAYAWSIGVPGKMPARPMTPFDLIHQAALFEVDTVQFDDNLPLHVYSEEELFKIINYANDHNLGLEVGTKKLTRTHTLNYLEIAAKCNSPFLRMVIDEQNYQPSVNEIIAIIKELIPEFEKKNIVLALENHDRFQAKVFKHIIEQVASDYLKICLDSVNSIGAGEGIEVVTEELAPFTVNLHLKAFEAKRLWHNMGFIIEGKPLGQGHLPLLWLLEKVRASCCSVTLELWPPLEENIEATIQKEQKWVEESIRYWKQNIINLT